MTIIDHGQFGKTSSESAADTLIFEFLGSLIEPSATETKSIDIPFLSGWNFLSVAVSPEDDAMPTEGVAEIFGPMIYFNEFFVSEDQMRDPAWVAMWLPSTLASICEQLISSDLGLGDVVTLYTGSRWTEFRAEICRQMCMDWDAVLASKDNQGLTYLCHTIAIALYAESGLHDCLVAQASGTRQLRIA